MMRIDKIWTRRGFLYFRGIGIGASLILLTACASSPAMVEKGKMAIPIGVVDTQWLLKESKLGRQANESLSKFMKDRQALIELEQKELRDLESQLMRQESILSPSAKQQREEQFRRRAMEYQQKVSDLNREVQEKQAQLFAEFRDEVDKVVADLSTRLGLVLVLEKGPSTSTRYFDNSLDLSQKVLDAMNQGNGK